jgi:hypothetical protein
MESTTEGSVPPVPDYLVVVAEDRENLGIWLAIKDSLVGLRAVSVHRERKQQAMKIALMLASNLDKVSALFKYPAIKEEYDSYRTEIARLDQHMNASTEALEQCASPYLRTYFVQQGYNVLKIEFFSKTSGVQVGRKALITYADRASQTQRQVTYFIKTHQYGSVSGSGRVKPVDPKELFVYKLLEYTGLGPKAHFFFNPLSQEVFYIATQDSGFSKDGDKQRHKSFLTFDKFKDSLLTGESIVDEEVTKGLTEADILSRILCLQDTTTNPTNFGLTFSDGKAKIKVIDFRVETRDHYRYRDIVGGFLSGNGMFNYCDDLLKKVLRERPIEERAHTASTVVTAFTAGMRGKKLPLAAAMDRAYVEVLDYMEQSKSVLKVEIPRDDLPHDFHQYYNDVKANFEQFQQGLEAYYREGKTPEADWKKPMLK